MKHFKFILASLALLVPVCAFSQLFSPPLRASSSTLDNPPVYENYKLGGGLATGKTVSGPVNDVYTLTLETFATGLATVTDVTKPSDIILVLDVSGSMVYNYTNSKGQIVYSYVRQASKGYSYYNYDDDLYYQHSDDPETYYRVYIRRTSNRPRRYYMTYNDGSRDYYLSGNSLPSTEPTYFDNADDIIWTGKLYRRGSSKMDALQQSVISFIDVVHNNALFDENKSPRTNPLDNQISIVKFAGARYHGDGDNQADASDDVSNSPYEDDIKGRNDDWGRYYLDDRYYCVYNYSQVRIGFTDVKASSSVTQLEDAIRTISSGGGTAAHYGLTKAKYLLETVKSNDSNKTVVFFTDGVPGKSGWLEDYANSAIAAAKVLKDNGAKVYAVGVFGDLDGHEDDVKDYMNYISSNYPNATDLDHGGTGDPNGGFSRDAGTEDLSDIFKDIAESSSKAQTSAASETQVRDVISPSFKIPTGFTADQVKVYTSAINTAGDTWGDLVQLQTEVIDPDDYNIETLPKTSPAPDYMTDPNKVGIYLDKDSDGNDRLVVLGFDYTKDDTKNEDGTIISYDGNWVGWRTNTVNSTTTKYCYGKKLVIKLKVAAVEGVTGGDGTNTNMSPISGVYVAQYDKNTGEFLGYDNINSYPYPFADLPITIVIEKSGLKHGESATVQIYYIPRSKTKYDPRTGKPAPDTDNYEWQNFSKVILTNKGKDNDLVTKKLLSLDPGYVYKLEEDNWGWGYDLDKRVWDTSSKETNPFPFDNNLKAGTVKHAEAVSINHFGTGAYTESYKSAKVQSFGED